MERQVPSGYGGGLALGGAVCVGIQASAEQEGKLIVAVEIGR